MIDELHRAVRLVVDTGMHAKGWSREQAIEYMAMTKGADATGLSSEVVSEIECYITMPGQALGYMIGMIKILDLRQEAQEQLRDNYDIRAFHDAVLIKGGHEPAIPATAPCCSDETATDAPAIKP